MYIKEGLVYEINTGQLVRYNDLGNYLIHLEQEYLQTPATASHNYDGSHGTRSLHKF